MFTVTKRYRDFPAAHRQPNHDGHCRLIHGHDWGFDITFACAKLDENGFVVDVGKLSIVKGFLTEHFDHTLLLNKDDPEAKHLRRVLGEGVELFPEVGGEATQITRSTLAKIVMVPNCGMEGLAQFVAVCVNELCQSIAGDRKLEVSQVTVWEDSKNSATYQLVL